MRGLLLRNLDSALSTSRIASRYSASFTLSPGPSPFIMSRTEAVTKSKMLRSRRGFASRSPGIGAVAIAKKVLEDRPRVILHGQWRRGSSPGERIRIRAAIARLACAQRFRGIERQFERCELGTFAELFTATDPPGRAKLRCGRSAPSVLFGCTARQKRGTGASVVTRTFARAMHELPCVTGRSTR